MNDEPQVPTTPTPDPTPKPDPTPAQAPSSETLKTVTPVPYERFKEVLDQKTAAEKRLAELEKAEQARVEAQMSEAQKIEAAKARAEKERDDAIAALTAAQTERLIERRDGIVEKAAAAALAKVAEDVVTWAEKYAPDALAKIVGEDGKQDEKALTGLIEACKTARPDWFGKPRSTAPGTPSNAGGSVIDGEDKAAREANFRRMRRNV